LIMDQSEQQNLSRILLYHYYGMVNCLIGVNSLCEAQLYLSPLLNKCTMGKSILQNKTIRQAIR